MNNKLKISFLIILVILVGILLSRFFLNKSKKILPGPQSDSQAQVTIEVTPVVLTTGEKPKFTVNFNTHSVDLSFNIEAVAVLADDNNNLIGSPKWTGSPPGGHHREGELEFNETLSQNAKAITLNLKNIGDVPDRKFVWKLQ